MLRRRKRPALIVRGVAQSFVSALVFLLLPSAAAASDRSGQAPSGTTDPKSEINACPRPPGDRYEEDLEPAHPSGEITWPPAGAWKPPGVPESPPPTNVATEPPAKTTRIPRLELSFGSTEKFYNQNLYDPGGFVTRKAVPVSTIRPVVDWLFRPEASVWLAFDLALEPRTELKEDAIIQTYVPPSILGGVRLTVFSVGLLDELWLDLQTDGAVGWLLSTQVGDNRVFPQWGWRLHLRDNSGFTAYAGASYEFRVNVGALVYGVGHYF